MGKILLVGNGTGKEKLKKLKENLISLDGESYLCFFTVSLLKRLKEGESIKRFRILNKKNSFSEGLVRLNDVGEIVEVLITCF